MNTAIEIKKISQNKDVVVVSRKEYESLLERQRFIPVVRLTLAEKKRWKKRERKCPKVIILP